MAQMMHLSLSLGHYGSINQGRENDMPAYYVLTSEDGQNTPVTVTGNTKCNVTVNITVNSYMIDIKAIYSYADRFYRSNYFRYTIGFAVMVFL